MEPKTFDIQSVAKAFSALINNAGIDLNSKSFQLRPDYRKILIDFANHGVAAGWEEVLSRRPVGPNSRKRRK